MVGGCNDVGTRIWCCFVPRDDYFRRMFRKGRYAQASVAFRRAGREERASICDAYVMQEKARLIPITASETRIQAFVTAANAFVTCAQGSAPGRAGERLVFCEAAGDCFKEARDLKKAANNYRLGGRYDKAALAYKEEGCIDDMVEVITQHKGTFTKSLHQRLTKFAQMHYFKVYANGTSCLNISDPLFLSAWTQSKHLTPFIRDEIS